MGLGGNGMSEKRHTLAIRVLDEAIFDRKQEIALLQGLCQGADETTSRRYILDVKRSNEDIEELRRAIGVLTAVR